ncbi:MAG: preprotein translocase subunit SecG [Clostridia bacterium]|nr:preprotein translocase subunit SecG [Clostridia bacterium]
MDILKNVLLVVYIIVCLVLILITTMQSKDNEKSLDDTYENPRFEKNKSRTRAGKIQKRTIIISVLFGILTVATTLVCYLV